MTRNQDIQMTLTRMAELLRLGDLIDWATGLEKLGYEMENAPDATIGRILALYGGMGSLNDLILYKSGAPLAKENDELDALRSRLFDLCHERKS